jgi:hypothetical protein
LAQGAAASGLHVIHVAAVHFGVMSSDTTPEALVESVADVRIRGRIESHVHRGGATDGDLRVLSDTAGLFFCRATKIDFDPLEPFSISYLVVLVVGAENHDRLIRRHVLILARSGDEITVADPAGKGLTIVAAGELRRTWKLAALRTPAWVGSVGSRSD